MSAYVCVCACVCCAFVQFNSVTQLCLTLCNPMNQSTPGLPVHHQFPELTQTYVHRVSDAIQPSHPLSSLLSFLPSIPSSTRVFSNESTLRMRWPNIGVSASTSVLPMNTQDLSPLGWTGSPFAEGSNRSCL